MHFKLLISLALVAACSADATEVKKNILVVVGDNSIAVTNKDGRQVNIVTSKLSDANAQRDIQVQVSGTGLIPKTLKIADQQVTAGGKYQSEILYQIFNKYTGQLDEPTYAKLISAISDRVQSNEIDPIVLYALQTVDYQNLGVNVSRNPFISSPQLHDDKQWQQPTHRLGDEDFLGRDYHQPRDLYSQQGRYQDQYARRGYNQIGDRRIYPTRGQHWSEDDLPLDDIEVERETQKKLGQTILGKEAELQAIARGRGQKTHLGDDEYVNYLLNRYQNQYSSDYGRYGYPGQYLGRQQYYDQQHGQRYGQYGPYQQHYDQYEPYAKQYEQYQPYGEQYDQQIPHGQHYGSYGQQYGDEDQGSVGYRQHYGNYGQHYGGSGQQYGGYGRRFGDYDQQDGGYGQDYGRYGKQYGGQYEQQYDHQYEPYNGVYHSGSGYGSDLKSTILRRIMLGLPQESHTTLSQGRRLPTDESVVTIEQVIVKEPKEKTTSRIAGHTLSNDQTEYDTRSPIVHHELYVNGVPVTREPVYDTRRQSQIHY